MSTLSRLAMVILLAPVLIQCASHGNMERSRPPENRSAFFELISTHDQASIKLIVKDGKTGKGLAGTVVQTADASAGVLTDVNGNAEIVGAPFGVHDIKIALVGYYPVTLENVAVIEGFTTNLGVVELQQGKIRFEPANIR